MEHTPWVEKYRPTEFNNIVLDTTNKKILINEKEKQYFPNLLFYGPPGTGKTTTIINLIKLYQTRYTSTRNTRALRTNTVDLAAWARTTRCDLFGSTCAYKSTCNDCFGRSWAPSLWEMLGITTASLMQSMVRNRLVRFEF